MDVIVIAGTYVAVMNIIGFASMGIDKAKAKKRAWRISESMLFLIAIFGGSIGSTIGMRVFHHKTRHWYFVFGMPAIIIIQALAILALIFSPIQFGIM